MKITGFSEYGGGSRFLMAVTHGPLVQIVVEGTEGNSEILLTPQQVLALSVELVMVAGQASKDTGMDAS